MKSILVSYSSSSDFIFQITWGDKGKEVKCKNIYLKTQKDRSHFKLMFVQNVWSVTSQRLYWADAYFTHI